TSAQGDGGGVSLIFGLGRQFTDGGFDDEVGQLVRVTRAARFGHAQAGSTIGGAALSSFSSGVDQTDPLPDGSIRIQVPTKELMSRTPSRAGQRVPGTI